MSVEHVCQYWILGVCVFLCVSSASRNHSAPYRLVSVLAGHVQRRLAHGVLHVHVGHVLHQVVQQLRAPVHRQPVDLCGRTRGGGGGGVTLYMSCPVNRPPSL